MRILLVNKFHYLRGGSEKYYFELAQLLKSKGHTVGFFSMKHEENITTGDAEYFVEEIDLNTGSKLKALDVIYSQENKRLMTKALEEFKPDIVHINNFQRQLSASIIDAIKEKNIPIVMTAHDLNPICPASIMLFNGEVCDDCITKGYAQCIKKKCVKGSTLKSALGVIEKKYYDFHKVFRKINCIISPSEFNKNQLINGRLKYNKIVALHNFVNESKRDDYVLGDYAFYLGRLSKEKGILNLIEAIGDIPNAKLLIAGDGPERERIEEYINEHKLDSRITLLGYQNQDSIHKYITNSRFVVIPSICNENCPYSVLEAMEIGKPIVASRIGGIPELIADGENGYLYKADDISELKEKLALMLEDDDKVNRFAQKSRELYENHYSPDSYYNELIKIYNTVMS